MSATLSATTARPFTAVRRWRPRATTLVRWIGPLASLALWQLASTKAEG